MLYIKIKASSLYIKEATRGFYNTRKKRIILLFFLIYIGNNKKISSAQNTSSSKSHWEYVPESEFKALDYFSNQVVLGSRRSSCSSSSAVATNKCSDGGSSTKK